MKTQVYLISVRNSKLYKNVSLMCKYKINSIYSLNSGQKSYIQVRDIKDV